MFWHDGLELARYPVEVWLRRASAARAAEDGGDCEGISAYESLVLLNAKLNSGDCLGMIELRTFAHNIQLMGGRPLRYVQDQELRRTVCAQIEAERLVAVRLWPKGSAASAGERGKRVTTPEARVVHQIMGRRRSISLRGEIYRLIEAGAWSEMADREDFQVVPQEQARAVFQRMGQTPGGQPGNAGPKVYEEAASMLVPRWVPGRDQGLLLLRLSPRRFTPTAPEPALTPSQLRAIRQKDLSWIEVLIVDEKKRPVRGAVVQITGPDGATVEVRTDGDGLVHVPRIAEGSCKCGLPGYPPAAWKVGSDADAKNDGDAASSK